MRKSDPLDKVLQRKLLAKRKEAEAEVAKVVGAETRPPEELPRLFKCLYTLSLYCTFTAFGLCRGLYGPTLGDLQLITGEPLYKISSLFTWLGTGGVLGSLTYGYLFDRFNSLPLLIVSPLCWGALTAAIPWCSYLPALMAVCAGQAFIFTGIAVGCNVVILRVWRERSNPMLLGLQVLFTVGCFMAPIVSEPFITDKPATHPLPLFTHHPDNQTGTLEDSDLRPCMLCAGNESKTKHMYAKTTIVPMQNTTIAEVSHSVLNGGHSKASKSIVNGTRSQVYKAYIITGAWIEFIAMFNIILYAFYRKHQISPAQEKLMNVTVVKNKTWLKYISWFLFLLFAMCFGGVETIYMGLLYTFANVHVGMDKIESSQLVAATFAAFGAGRVLALFFTQCFQIGVVITVYLLCALFGSAALAYLVDSSAVGLWCCAVTVYLGIAPLFGSCLIWAKDYLQVSGRFTSTYVIGYTTGMMTWPLLAAHMIHTFGSSWFPYLATGLLSGCVIVVTILWVIRYTMKVALNEKVLNLTDLKIEEEGSIFASMRSLHTI